MMPEASHCLLPPDTNDYPPGCVAANGNSAGFKPISSTPNPSAELPLPRGVEVLTCPHSLYVIKPEGLLILLTISEVH